MASADKPETPAKPETKELTAVRTYGQNAFHQGLSNGHPRGSAGIIAEYRKMLTDDQVFSTWQQRRRAVTSVTWEVEPASDAPLDIAAADDLREQIGDLDFDRITDKMLHALFFGYAVAECLFELEVSRVALTDIRVRKPERFRIDLGGDLYFIDSMVSEQLMPDNKFWCFTDAADNDDDPYGPGLGSALYWPVFMKMNGGQFWAIYLERYGAPTPKATFPAGMSKPDKKALLDILQSINTSAAVAVPDGVELDLLEATRSSRGNHDLFMAYWDKAIAKIILSQTMTTDDGSSKSQAAVHADVKIEVVRGDADLICESFNNGPGRWLTRWNFPGAGLPKVWRRVKAPEDLTDRATREKIVSETTGLRPTREHVEEIYGGKWEEVPQAPAPVLAAPVPPATVPAATSASFADADEDELGDLRREVEEKTNALTTAMIGQIRAALDASDDLAAFADQMLEMYSDIDESELAKILAEAMTLSHLQGRAEIIDG